MTVPNQAAFNSEVISAGISDTNAGILVGVDPTTAPQPKAPEAEAPQAPVASRFTEEDIARARQQEKDKLYPQLDELKSELAVLRKEREEREAAEKARLAEADEAARKQEESQLDVRALIEKKEAEWQERLLAEQRERENAFALLEQERQYQELMAYRASRLAQEQDAIIPELLDLVEGNSEQEVDASIEALKERSARILESAQEAAMASRRGQLGARVTAPGVGPMDTTSEQQQFTPEMLKGMSMNEYAKNRSRLLGQTRQGGMFG